jgi:gamma-glutamyltranspeptidase/glutathione hydrolase
VVIIWPLSSEISAGSPEGYVSEETTHYSVTDEFGNAVAATTTLNNTFGSSIVVDGAGFLLNNQMDDFSVKPGFPNLYGLIGGEANSIKSGKRMLSSMTPTIVEKDGKLFIVLGMKIGEAVDAGRFHHQWLPDWIMFESDGIDSLTVNTLKQMGHEMKQRASIGRVNAIQILEDGQKTGSADKRGDNASCGY